jgi:glycosyltransferase involved in cell wall biosynthesis
MNRLFFLLKISLNHLREHGLRSFILKARKNYKNLSKVTKIDVNRVYGFLEREKFGVPWDESMSNDKVVNWVIPNFGIGSGGHLNIFRFISYLEKKGYFVNIIIDDENSSLDGEKIRSDICKHFVKLNAKVFIGIESSPPAYATFATSWNTAYSVNAFNSTCHKFYFVQDYEPYFYALGSEYMFAENTYRFGFKGITAGSWLSNKLSKDFGMKCASIGFSYEKDRYSILSSSGKSLNNKVRIFFYARPPTPRRALELGLLALEDVCRKRANVEVVFAGWDMDNYEISFPYESHGVVALDNLSALYNSCDVGLVLSLTNLSLLPLELMASGVPVVSNSGDNVEWLLNEDICEFSDLTVSGISSSLIKLIDDDEKRQQLKMNGLNFISSTSWDAEGEMFVNKFEQLLKEV